MAKDIKQHQTTFLTVGYLPVRHLQHHSISCQRLPSTRSNCNVNTCLLSSVAPISFWFVAFPLLRQHNLLCLLLMDNIWLTNFSSSFLFFSFWGDRSLLVTFKPQYFRTLYLYWNKSSNEFLPDDTFFSQLLMLHSFHMWGWQYVCGRNALIHSNQTGLQFRTSVWFRCPLVAECGSRLEALLCEHITRTTNYLMYTD